MTRRCLAALLACSALAACSGGGEKSERERQRAASWVASAREAAAAWRAHAVSTLFAREVARRAGEEIGRKKAGKLPADARAAAEEAVPALRDLEARLRAHDDAAVRAGDAALAAIEARLRGGR